MIVYVFWITKEPFFVGAEECEALFLRHNRKKEMTYNTSKKEKKKLENLVHF